MKVLTLWEPWASLMAIGAKRIETRSWPTSYRGLLAIHAGKRPVDRDFESDLDVARALVSSGIKNYSLGSIIGVVNVIACKQIATGAGPMIDSSRYMKPPSRVLREYTFGNYEAGRFAWITDQAWRLSQPIEFRGSQGLRNLPEGVALQVLAQIKAL